MLSILVGILCLGSVLATPLGASDLKVVTSSGTVEGIYNNTAKTVRGFLGIPYAESPVGNLRWAPPVAKSSSKSVIDASTFSSPCLQTYSYSNTSIWSVLPYDLWNSNEMSEDCLYMNVWAPTSQKKEKAAVLLFIYGGGFTEGATSVAYYDGTPLVANNEDTIVVTFNYRLNVFGYPNAPGLEYKQNVGLLDQRLAIEWVSKNIAQFGGDPDKILLFGQSTGASSVDLYSYAYPEDPIVSAFALESGNVYGVSNTDYTYSNWKALSKVFSCGNGTESVDCMRKVSAERILAEYNNGDYTFTPIPDNATVFEDYEARSKDGKMARLPTLVGGNHDEITGFDNIYATTINETSAAEGTQSLFNCPIHQSVLNRLDANVQTYRYLYHGNFSNLSPNSWLGAYHHAELPIVFGTYDKYTKDGHSSTEEIEASRSIQSAWVAFAKNPTNGLKQRGWPVFSFNGGRFQNMK